MLAPWWRHVIEHLSTSFLVYFYANSFVLQIKLNCGTASHLTFPVLCDVLDNEETNWCITFLWISPILVFEKEKVTMILTLAINYIPFPLFVAVSQQKIHYWPRQNEWWSRPLDFQLFPVAESHIKCIMAQAIYKIFNCYSLVWLNVWLFFQC